MKNKFIIFLFLVLSQQAFAADSNCAKNLETVIVNGTSMIPLLKDKEEVELDKNYYSCNSIKRGDIVVFEIPGRQNRIIKRVHAIPGDKFEYKKNKIIINGKIAKNSAGEEYNVDSKMLLLYSKDYPILPQDSFLVLGDQPRGTFDASRMGFIDRKQIIGNVKKTKGH